MGRKRKYFTEEERKAAQREAVKRHYQNNREKKLEYQTEYNKKNKEKLAEYHAEYDAKYYSTPKGRASNLAGTYKQEDKKYGRGECTITAKWILENIFNGQVCHYCGKADWRELGCDRIDNSLPHTPDNVVPCCKMCNIKKGTMSYDEYMKKIGKIKCEEVTIE